MPSPQSSSLRPAVWGVLGVAVIGIIVAGTTNSPLSFLRGQTQDSYGNTGDNYTIDFPQNTQQTSEEYNKLGNYNYSDSSSSQSYEPGFCCAYFKQDPVTGEWTDFNYGAEDAECNVVPDFFECPGFFYVDGGEFYDPLDPNPGNPTVYDAENACSFSCVNGYNFTPVPPSGATSQPTFGVLPYPSTSSASAQSRSAASNASTTSARGGTFGGLLPYPPTSSPNIDPVTPVHCCKIGGSVLAGKTEVSQLSEVTSDQFFISGEMGWNIVTYGFCIDPGYDGRQTGVVAGTAEQFSSPADLGIACTEELSDSCDICEQCHEGGLLARGRCTDNRCNTFGIPGQCTYEGGIFGLFGQCVPNPEYPYSDPACQGNLCDVCGDKDDAASCTAVGEGGYCAYNASDWWDPFGWFTGGCEFDALCQEQVLCIIKEGVCDERPESTCNFAYYGAGMAACQEDSLFVPPMMRVGP